MPESQNRWMRIVVNCKATGDPTLREAVCRFSGRVIACSAQSWPSGGGVGHTGTDRNLRRRNCPPDVEPITAADSRSLFPGSSGGTIPAPSVAHLTS
jgi:hypothetical protein